MAGPHTGDPKLAPGQMLLSERGSCMHLCTLLHSITSTRNASHGPHEQSLQQARAYVLDSTGSVDAANEL